MAARAIPSRHRPARLIQRKVTFLRFYQHKVTLRGNRRAN
jgi:hypothetical protein